jgi:dolichol kinase
VSTISQKQPQTDLQHNVSLQPIDESYRIELIRKSIHLTSIIIPIVYFFTPRSLALEILIPLTFSFFIVDISRYYSRPLELWFNKTFGWLLRKHEYGKEHKRLNGATYVLLAGTIAVFIFPKLIAVTSFSVLILCDLTAALIGKRFGKHRLFKKSIEGTLAFLITGILIIILLPKIEYSPVEYVVCAAAVACGALVEALPIDIDDNLSIPLTVGAIMWAGYAIFLPVINLNKF